MAYYAASPPPDRAPSLAPTNTSESEGAPKKKKSGFMKRALKELSGGGGNNPKQPKGSAVVRPYGRGGVGVKAKAATTSSSQTSSQSPANSTINSSHPTLSSRGDYPPSPHSEYDQDDTQSQLSSIPAPRRTQQWIAQQNPSQHLAPPNVGSPPLARPIPTHYRPPESPAPSTFTRSDDNPTPKLSVHQQLYAHPHQVPYRHLHDVQEAEDQDDFTENMDDQFGRLTLSGPRSTLSQNTHTSRDRRPTPSTVRSATLPTAGYGNTLYHQDSVQSRDYNPRYEGSLAHGPSLQPRNLTHHPTEDDPYSSPQQITTQTQELQAQIEQLREAEQRAREKLDALRKEELATTSVQTPIQAHAHARDDSARAEKERLRQRDAARELEERAAAASASAASGSSKQHHQPAFAHGYAPNYAQQQAYSQLPYNPVPSPPQPVYQDSQQQQLILQLGTLLLQQQQQLAALGIARAGSGYPSPDGKPPAAPMYPGGGGLDLNALLALGAAQAAAQSHSSPVHTGYSSLPHASGSGHASQSTIPTSASPQIHPNLTADPDSGRPHQIPSRGSSTSPTNTQPLQIRRKLSTGTPITNAFNRDQGNPPLPGSSSNVPPLGASFAPSSPFSNSFPPEMGLGAVGASLAPAGRSAVAASSSRGGSPRATAASLSPPPPPYVGRSSGFP